MRPSRVERTTTSCGECRRRKQKCNQGQPCSNCSRRFPPPPCEYKTINRRQLSPANIIRQPVAFPSSPYPNNNPGFDPSGAFQPSSSSSYALSLPSQWSESHLLVDREVVRWSGLDLVTRFPPSTNTRTLYPFEKSFPFSQPSPTINLCHVSPLNNVSHAGSTGGQGSPALLQNNPGMSDFFLLPDWMPHGFTEEAMGWFTMSHFEQDLAHDIRPFDDSPTGGQVAGPPAPALTPSTQQDDELLRIFVRTLAPFHAALDGVADPSHPYLKRYVPFILQSPLLCQTSIYHSTGFLRDQGHMDKATMLLYKAQAIGLFNSNVLSQPSPSDEIIAAHIQLTLNEWCWSDSTELGPHLRALKEMIRSRGGLQSLGLQFLIAKMAITLDTSTSLSTSAPPILRPFCLSEPASSRVTSNLRFNTPFVSYFPGFGCCIEAMNLDPVTAKVLDELRFLINAVLALPKQASEVELAKIRVTGSYVYNCILGLGDAASSQTQPQLPPPSHSYSCSHPATHRPTNTNDLPASTRMPSIVLMDEGGLRPGPTASARRRPGVQRSTSSPIISLSYGTTSGRASSEQHFQQEIPLLPLLNPPPFSAQQPIADPLFPTIRLAALIYASAITNRQSFHSMVTEDDFTSLWQAFWKVPLSRWKEVLGVSNWILVPFLPIARGMKQGRIVKNMVFNGLFTMAIEDWEVATSVMERTEGLRMWLAGEGPG